uniref:Uncharacterized protein n=1 Tax=Candidatus Kentrum sp. SD TaxID=2126332 RepID=A0A450Y8Z8_9GAMM|nr:MAG: hypothetical protein BECKSD772F_GA0070984_102016 [Candidatus Kentron sp. SD]VFK42733.1 MAG: hypothetical protein BECKSD772E_GA0070983_101916 [Candidatus Kentron sp. SD]
MAEYFMVGCSTPGNPQRVMVYTEACRSLDFEVSEKQKFGGPARVSGSDLPRRTWREALTCSQVAELQIR